jgi:hypothetical protein
MNMDVVKIVHTKNKMGIVKTKAGKEKTNSEGRERENDWWKQDKDHKEGN